MAPREAGREADVLWGWSVSARCPAAVRCGCVGRQAVQLTSEVFRGFGLLVDLFVYATSAAVLHHLNILSQVPLHRGGRTESLRGESLYWDVVGTQVLAPGVSRSSRIICILFRMSVLAWAMSP